jgi:hypothetical protein
LRLRYNSDKQAGEKYKDLFHIVILLVFKSLLYWLKYNRCEKIDFRKFIESARETGAKGGGIAVPYLKYG